MIATAKTQVEPGIYRSMPDHEYRAIDALSNSDLTAWAKGEQDKGIDPRNAVFGTASHGIVLEPEVARQKLVCLEPKQKRSSYEGPEDMWVLTNSDYQKLMGCFESMKAHPQGGKLLDYARDNRDRCEVALVWICPTTGLKMKAKVDLLSDEWLYDLKTTQSDPDSFGYAIAAYLYLVQAAHYLIGAKECGLDVKGFRFACQCKRKDKGYPFWIHEVTPELLSAGIKMREVLVSLYARFGGVA